MKQIILVAHGNLGQEMKNSGEMIFGELPNFCPISFLKEEGLDSLTEKITWQVKKADETLILTDLFCGTPYNAGCSAAMKETDKTIEVLSGMSLPLILEAATNLEHKSVTEVAAELKAIACDVVKSFSDQIIAEEEDF